MLIVGIILAIRLYDNNLYHFRESSLKLLLIETIINKDQLFDAL